MSKPTDNPYIGKFRSTGEQEFTEWYRLNAIKYDSFNCTAFNQQPTPPPAEKDILALVTVVLLAILTVVVLVALLFAVFSRRRGYTRMGEVQERSEE